MARVVVLGGGFGGAAAALEARRLLGNGHPVTLVDRSPIRYLCGANPLIAVGRQAPGSAVRSLPDLARHGVEFAAAEVEDLAIGDGRVTTSAGTLDYDYLVVALGASYDRDAVPGVAAAHSFYDHDSTVALRAALERFTGGTVLIGVVRPPIKCPPAPFEAAMLMDAAFRRRGIRDRVDLHVAIPEPEPLGVAGADAARTVRHHLDAKGIRLHTGAPVESIEGRTAHLGDQGELEVDLPVIVPAHRMPDVVAASRLGTGEWVRVDAATLETHHQGVFAIGDLNAVPTRGGAVPKAGVFAAGQGRTVAGVIASRELGTEPPPPYDGAGHCFLAFSESESALVGGTFLASGGPDVALGEPSAEGMAAKARFARDWESFRL